MNFSEMSEIRYECESSQRDAVMRHYSCNNTVFFLDMLHTATDGVESQDKWLCTPEP